MIKIINSINRTVKSSKLSNGKNINFKGEANIKNDSVELSPLGRKISVLSPNGWSVLTRSPICGTEECSNLQICEVGARTGLG